MQLIPSSFRYGIFSRSPANVPGAVTCEDGCRVKPRTWVSYTTRSSAGSRSGVSSPQSKSWRQTRERYW